MKNQGSQHSFFLSITFTIIILIEKVICQTAVIGNDYVIMGIDTYGNLNIPYVGDILNLPSSDPAGIGYIGLRNGALSRSGYVAGAIASTEPGCLCEGWGFGANYLDILSMPQYSETFANNAFGDGNINLVSFVGSNGDNQAVSTVTDNIGLYLIRHNYIESSISPYVFEVRVSIKNISPFTFTETKYRRVMDWDIGPNYFNEFVSIVGTATTTTLDISHDNGFASAAPSVTSTELTPGTTNVDFTDAGPRDHGALFQFKFGSLEPGEWLNFTTLYGVAPTEADAINALIAEEAEIYTLGQELNDPTGGTPFTFFFGFKEVGGVPTCDLFECPKTSSLCVYSPCHCNHVGSSDFDPHCIACHSNGCNQCESGYFKIDYNHKCVSCSTVMGAGCLFCQDFNGCGQCASGYQRVYDSNCGLYICENLACGTKADTSATSCDALEPCEHSPCTCSELQYCRSCHSNGCNQCQNGYFKKDYNYPCIECQQVFGESCLFCQDFIGCGQCQSGKTRVYDSSCGLYKCV